MQVVDQIKLISMKKFKLGDIIERFTYYTGIQWIFYKFVDKEDCGCDKRQEYLNNLNNRND